MKTEEKFLNDTKTQILQHLYRSLQEPTSNLTKVLQEASGNNNLNWQNSENKQQLADIFTKLATSISNYTLINGDFRTYVLLQLVAITYSEYSEHLFSQFLKAGYNISPESVVGSLSTAYSTQPPQNTNFPGEDNTSNDYLPISVKERLVSESLYETDGLD